MRKLLVLLTLSAAGLLAQTMVLTPSYISTLKARVNNVNPVPMEWTNLRSTCDWVVQYTANTPDHLPPVYASMEGASDGSNGNYMRLGTDGNYYEGTGISGWGNSASLCYLTLKDGDVTPYGWSYTWNGISLTPQQYGILAGIQAIKILNKATPTMVHMAPVSPPAVWHGMTWRQVDGVFDYRMDRSNSTIEITGSVDATVAEQLTTAQTNSGTNTLYFTNTTTAAYGSQVFTVGDYAVGLNIPAGTTILTVTPNTSITLSANVTGNIPAGTMIADLIASDNCLPSTGTSQVFVGSPYGAPAGLSTHAPVVFANIVGPLGTIMNGNTYYVDPANKTTLGFNSNSYGFYLDTDSGGTPLCVTVNQGVDYRGHNVGSGENYNHQPQEDNEFSPRFFVTGMSMLYDWLHPLLNQSVAAALNTLAASEPTAVKNTFTAGGTAWNASTNPWTGGSATIPGNYPQAIPTAFSTLQAQVLDSMDCWTRDLLWGYYSGNDVGAFTTTMNNYHQGVYSALGMAGIAAYNDDARGQAWYDYWRNHMHLLVDQPYSARWMGPNGAPMDSYNYAPTAVENITLTLLSNWTAFGDNLITNASQPFTWIEGVEYYKHNLDPGGLSMLSRGYIFAPAAIPPCVNCASTSELIAVQAMADLGGHPLANKFRSFVQNQINLYGEPAGDWMPFVLWNPAATQTAWNDEPTVLGNLANPAGGFGHAFMRSDWTSTAAYASFYARPAVFDYGNGKDPYDFAGSLIVQRGQNALSVEADGECARNFPVTQAGAGATIAANAANCMSTADGNKGYHGYGNWSAGFYKIKSTAGNPSTTTSVPSVTLSTSTDTPSGATLTFTSTTGVTTGMIAVAANIPANAFVLAVTSTTVILNQAVSADVPASTPVIFATFGSYPMPYSGSADGDVAGIMLMQNGTYLQPGQADAAPVSPAIGATWTNSPSYTVASATLTVSPTIPTSFSWGNGTTVLFTWATGATPPTYYLSGSSGATESVIRGDPYVIVNWNPSGTFGVIKAPTYIGNGGSYPTTGTALVFATNGTGTQYVQGTPGVLTPKGHPARIDLLESTANYAYARGVGLEADYMGMPNTTTGSRVLTSQREVLYLLPKLFLVYDRTQQTHQLQQAVSFTSIIDAAGGNPITLVTGGHSFHSGMQVVLSSVAGTGCSGLAGTYIITALDGNDFALNGQTSALGHTACTGTATGNKWGHQLISWTTGAIPTEVTTGGQITAGMRQWHVKAPAVSIASIGNTTPVTVVTSAPHLMNSGMSTVIAGQSGGCVGLNGAWWITAVDLYTFTLNGSTACGAVGAVGTSQKFNGAITTIKPATPPAVLQDPMLTVGQTAGSGMIYRLEIHDPRNCTSNASWCQAAGADTADSQNWLTALDASVSASDTATLTPLTATNADMVQVSAGVVAGFQNAQVGSGNCSNYTCTPPVPVLPISYTFTYQSGSTAHTLAGMLPSTAYKVDTSTLGSVAITASGSGSTITATANGVLAFTSAGSSSPPAPTISSLSPSSVTAGASGQTLTVNGANFDSSCAITWNSTGLTTTYVGTTQCTAPMTTGMLATPGTASVTITTTGGGTSSPSTFTISAPFVPTTLGGKLSLGGLIVIR